MAEGFSIGVLADRTGLTPTVLRTWENRFGFPVGTRSPSGRRRFSDADVELVREVQDLRSSGASLGVAVDTVQRRHRRRDESVHAVLARDFPHLGRQRLGRRALVAASYAVEDEALARAERPLVLGSFQAGHRFADQRHRWDELARTAAWSAVVAKLRRLPAGGPGGQPGPVPAARPLGPAARVDGRHADGSAGCGGLGMGGARPVLAPLRSTSRSSAATGPPRSRQPACCCAAVRSVGAVPAPGIDDLLDAPTRPDNGAADADRMWLRALARLDGER